MTLFLPENSSAIKSWDKMTRYEKNQVLEEESRWRYWKESQEASIEVTGAFPDKKIKIYTDRYNAYSGKHNFLCNVGYSRKPIHTVTLTFENTGIYTFDTLKIVSQPVKRSGSRQGTWRKMFSKTFTRIPIPLPEASLFQSRRRCLFSSLQ